MKIGLDASVLNDAQKTGIGVYAYELIKALLQINKKDRFVLFGIATLSTYDYLKNLEFSQYPNVEMKIYKMPAKFFRTTFLTWQKLNWPPIEKFIGSVDIFHSFNWFMPPQKNGKKVATVFDLTSILYPEWHELRTTQLDKTRFENIAKKADLIVAISENTKKDFLKIYPQCKVEVVYPAASGSLNTKTDVSLTRKVIRKYGLKPGYFLSVGTLEPRKNLETLIASYLKSGLSSQLVLVGKSGWRNEKLMSLISKHRQEVKQLGFVPDEELKIIYQQALAFLYPSFYEGFGIPVLEAMKCGVPVIASKTSSLPEVGGDAVLYIDPHNMQSIKDALQNIYCSDRLRKKMSKKGLQQAKKFSWQKSAKILNSLYQNL